MAAPRPRSVTLACLYSGCGAAFVFIILVSQLGSWGSVQMQEQIEQLLAEPPLSATSLSVDTTLEWLRWMVLIGVVGTIATMVFAVFAFRGDRGSRIGLTVLCSLAALLFVTMGLVGILPALLAAMCVGMLWQRESRQYFAGEEPPVELGATPSVPAQQSPHAPPQITAQRPQASSAHQGYAQTMPPPPSARSARPKSVTAALLVTGVGSAVVAGVAALLLLTVLVGGRAEVERAWQQQGMVSELIAESGFTVDDLMRLMIVSAAGWLLLSLVGMAVTAWAFAQRSPIARIALVVVCVLTIAVSIVFFPVGLPWTAAAVAVIVLAHREEARAWYRGM
ncbi:hypothetical protein BHE97_00035 [Aeromicrobium sp. PE09-221]|uniref:hypothetical protein n=1 Tax=Aeromicrobium sp. PE09-221 TaxID=1898043 RepID=UPI000B3E97D3|nr:hypothetical protein [Aeromicrobium sp. PE09-221]OUZ12894.1 hypothetical protein BHE97_00035 [Aeromicrobium sp. PE09-221]